METGKLRAQSRVIFLLKELSSESWGSEGMKGADSCVTVSEAHWWLMGQMNAFPMFSVHPKPTMSFGDPLNPSFSSLEFACFGLMNGGRRHETLGSETNKSLSFMGQQTAWAESSHWFLMPLGLTGMTQRGPGGVCAYSCVSQLTDAELRVPQDIRRGCKHSPATFGPKRDIIFNVLGSKQTCPLLQKEDTVSISQGCSLCKHPWKDKTIRKGLPATLLESWSNME